MCGRFTVNYTYEELLQYLDDEYSVFDMKEEVDLPRYNMAPGQQIISIISDGENYRAGTFKWGFVPSFSKDSNIGYKMINARSEDIEEKMSFKDSFFNKRCIVLSDGFYEWDNIKGTKKPYYISFKDKKIRAYAGIWSRYIKDGKPIYTCAIITTGANKLVGEIHHRMPVILTEEKAKLWLNNKEVDLDKLKSLMVSYDSDLMFKHQVSEHINKVSNDDELCIKEYNELTLF